MTGQQLKNSILQWAIQGKLVPQIASEGTAEDLLKEIRAEKEKLVKEGKLKKKDLEVKPIEDDEIPFEIPEEWRWCRLCDISYLNRGRSQHRPRNDKSLFVDGTIPFVQTGDVANANVYITKCNSFYNEKGLSQSRLWEKGTLCMTIAANIGDVAILKFDACFPDSIVGFKSYYPIKDNMYFLYALKCYKDILDKMSYSTAQKNINIDILQNLIFPLPPLSEQKRIVAKIEELMPLVEQYGKAQEQLEALNNELPETLKKSVLQEAIMGKLVPQDPKEGTADELLAEIRKEKEKLVKEGKLKKKDLEVKPIEEDEVPFEVPEGWRWCRWGDLSFSIQYGFNAPAQSSGTIKMVRISDIHDNKVSWDSVPYCEIKELEIETYKLQVNDILFARTGGTVGKSFLVTEIKEDAVYAGYLIRTRFSKNIFPKYAKIFMETATYWEQLREGTIATAQPNCNGQTLSKMMIPIPPLSEQKRIVTKVEEVMGEIEGMKR